MGRKLREENGIRLPARVWRVIDTVRGGQKLCKYLHKKPDNTTDARFFVEPDGRKVSAESAVEAIASGLLKPLGDGLFEADTSQTWVAQ